jgi:hypothetical protein
MKRDEPMKRYDSSRVGRMRVKWRSVVACAGFTTLCLSARQSLADEHLFGFTGGVFGFDVSGPPGASVVIQASTDLQNWIPLQTNLLGSGLLYFSDSQSPANVRRFYRAQLSP